LIRALLVGAGGFLGSVLQYLLGGIVQSAVAGSTFPSGTPVVNVTGCFAIGLVSQLIETQEALGSGARAFLVVGILGGYTTFSALVRPSNRLQRTTLRRRTGALDRQWI
jgi:CrcB protein